MQRVVGAVRERWPDLKVALHLHDTRGMGIAKALVLRLLHAGTLTVKQRTELVAAAREAYAERLAVARAAARATDDPYGRPVADFAVAHTRAMIKLIDAIPQD